MSLFSKFDGLRAAHAKLTAAGADPFSVVFEDIVSATEGILHGQRTVLLGTNNYLGLTFDEAGKQASMEAVARHGTGTTGSRIANGSYDGHARLEAELAAFFGRRHGMVFSTGYQANLGILSTLAGKHDHLVIDSDSHASIYDGARLGHAPVVRFRHNDPKDLEKRLARLADEPGEKIIVVEGIYSMLGDSAPLAEICELKRRYGAYLIVDEAHSMGVLGENGRGLAEELGVENDVDFVIGTFSKSLGSVGGFCVSSLEGFETLRIACRPYMFTASLPPAIIASTSRALTIVGEQPELRARLRGNAERLYHGLSAAGFVVGPECSPIVSVIIRDVDKAVAFWNMLLERGLYVNLALPPATPSAAAFLRGSVSASHSEEQIAFAVDVMSEVGRELGLLPSKVTELSARRRDAKDAKEPARPRAAGAGAATA
ncbi:serine palmitoyltransferase [Pararhizobium mangrovi]|uniref:Aminotransferase class I/II-fold pyridoxal phosphate-dependent enzyme n=1 Tax=Pararhizobium mangrovi TaxID=2590452 RepID=A0A506U6E6_9HYPH|nr:aminotransferase class I/II-fold pyridoxal phosphate-dependent enzyme [Pararhizobium mangrovi]TPW29943.1 aminotransferase class I/II-fold pyridoxal phosphate-dependent enzyme [Pararhizobium mangrovi]